VAHRVPNLNRPDLKAEPDGIEVDGAVLVFKTLPEGVYLDLLPLG